MYSIEKVLRIETPIEFYRLLLKENWMTGGVDSFLKSYFKWTYGCPCDSEKNWNLVLDEYRELKNKDLSGLMKKIGCDKIEFKIW